MNLEILNKIIIEIPVSQIAILAGLCTLVALIGKTKFTLLFLYGAILYWVFILNISKFGFSDEANLLHTALFILTSIIFVACAAWTFIVDR